VGWATATAANGRAANEEELMQRFGLTTCAARGVAIRCVPAGVHRRGEDRQLHAGGRLRDGCGPLDPQVLDRADTESVPSLIAVSVVTPIFVPEVVLFVPDVIFAKDRR
jgi:hypothetical protein